MRKQQTNIVRICLIATAITMMFAGHNVRAEEHLVSQQNKTFIKNDKQVSSMKIKQGDIVHFLNGDPFFHNIHSLSKTKTFDLGSYPKGESRSVKFDKKGKVEIECAIHTHMYLELTVE